MSWKRSSHFTNEAIPLMAWSILRTQPSESELELRDSVCQRRWQQGNEISQTHLGFEVVSFLSEHPINQPTGDNFTHK